MDPKITEEIKKQEDALDQSIALNKITVMLLDERKKELKKIWVFFFAVCVAFVALFSIFAYTTHKEKQELMTQLNDTRADFMRVEELICDVDKELKHLERLTITLKSVAYDEVYIAELQHSMHEKYKRK